MKADSVRRAMSQQETPSTATEQERPQGDPWHAFGYIVSGVLLYGALGWILDRWLETTFLVAIGILLGAGLGIWMTFARFRQPSLDPQTREK